MRCNQCGDKLTGYFQFSTCSACYSLNVQSAQAKRLAKEKAMPYIKPPDSGFVPWYEGPPPEIGWWPASCLGYVDSIRWWDGACWSIAADMLQTSDYAANMAAIKDEYTQTEIRWTPRWWIP